MQMRFTLCSLAFLAASPALAAETPRALASRISEVTVFADRAEVTHTAAIDVDSGVSRVSFPKLPGWIDEGSVRVSIAPADAARIVDVEVQRDFLAKASEEDVRKAQAAVQDVADQLAALDDERAVLDAEAKQIESIRAFTLDKLPKDVMTRDVKVASFAESVDFVDDRLRKNAIARRALDKKKRDLAPELAARQAALADLQQKSQLEQRTVIVTLDGAAAKSATLSLRYLTPGATWEPTGELRASPGSPSVSLTNYAIVTQTTGEDWEGAKISLSTQRPEATLALPELQALTVGGTSLAQMMENADSSFAQAQSSYAAQNALVGKGKSGYDANVAVQQEVQQRVTAEFASLQQRGTTAQFPALGSATVRDDGKPVRLPLGGGDLAATHRILAAPEVSPNAAETIDLVNSGSQPILPGKLALYMDGAFLGTTELPFVAQGESFSVFAGTADRIKLARVLDKSQSHKERGGKRTRVTVSWLITAQNLGDAATQLALADRIPVSRVGEIKISDVKIQPDVDPDDKGLLHWQLALGPKQSRTFRVEYAIEYPTDLLLTLDQKKAAEPTPAANVYDDIDRLEKSL